MAAKYRQRDGRSRHLEEGEIFDDDCRRPTEHAAYSDRPSGRALQPVKQKFQRIHTTDRHNDIDRHDKYYCPGDDLADLISAAHHSRLSAGKTFPNSTCAFGKRGHSNGDQPTAGPFEDDIADIPLSFNRASPMFEDHPHGRSASHLGRSGMSGRGMPAVKLRYQAIQSDHVSQQSADELLRRRNSGVSACPPDLIMRKQIMSQRHDSYGQHRVLDDDDVCAVEPQTRRRLTVNSAADDLLGRPPVNTSSSVQGKSAEGSEVASSNHGPAQPGQSLGCFDENSVLFAPAETCAAVASDLGGGRGVLTVSKAEACAGNSLSKDDDALYSFSNTADFTDHRAALERELLDFVNID